MDTEIYIDVVTDIDIDKDIYIKLCIYRHIKIKVSMFNWDIENWKDIEKDEGDIDIESDIEIDINIDIDSAIYIQIHVHFN